MIVELTTGVTDLIAVKLLDGATDIKTHRVAGRSDLIYKIDGRFHYKSLPPGNWLPIGFLKDITEEQAREIVPLYAYELYKDYATQPEITDNGVKVYGFQEALKSLHSLLQSKQVYTVNPYGEKPEEEKYFDEVLDDHCHRVIGREFNKQLFGRDLARWAEAEQRVGNWFLLRKEAEK